MDQFSMWGRLRLCILVLRRRCPSCRHRTSTLAVIVLFVLLHLWWGYDDGYFVSSHPPSTAMRDTGITTTIDELPPGFEIIIQEGNSVRNASTLVIATGSLRGGEPSWQSLYRHVLDLNGAELALVVSRDSPRNTSLFRRSKYILLVPEFDDWADAMDLIPHHHPHWRRILLGSSVNCRVARDNILLGAAAGISGSGALVFMYRYFVSHYLVQRHNMHNMYQRFIITRTDHYYGCPHNVQALDPHYLWVPTEEDHKGICDRHLVVGAKHVLKAIHLLPPMVLAPHEYRQLFRIRGYNTEQFMKRRWDEQGLPVRRFNRTMFLAQVPGDSSRWSEAEEAAKEFGPNLMAKYPLELFQTRKSCRVYLLQNPPLGGLPLPPAIKPPKKKKRKWWQRLLGLGLKKNKK